MTLEIAGRDRYRRNLARVRLPGGRLLGREMVRAGCAWRYRAYSADPALVRAEAAARAARRGLWAATPAPTPPWTWRAEHPRP